jgi:CheY-like chemotaxis protein
MSPWNGRPALAADDNEDSRKLASLILKREGMVVSQAEDGQQALDLVTGAEFDLVLMDLEMPVMSGLDAIRAIRALQPPRTIKIVGLSAHADEAAKRECLAAGADAYLVKPMRLADLQKVLAGLFGTAR